MPTVQLNNIDQALAQLVAVRREMIEMPAGLSKYQREARLIEPMSRLALVCRFLDEILARNGWSRSMSA